MHTNDTTYSYSFIKLFGKDELQICRYIGNDRISYVTYVQTEEGLKTSVKYIMTEKITSQNSIEYGYIYNETAGIDMSIPENKTEDITKNVEFNNEIETEWNMEELGKKPYEVMSYIRDDEQENETFIEKEKQRIYPDGLPESIDEQEWKAEMRTMLYHDYKVVQKEPFILKVKDKNPANLASYLDTYSYYSMNGYVFWHNDKWYELKGYKNYKENFFISGPTDCYIMFETETEKGNIQYRLPGFDAREDDINEQKIRSNFENRWQEENAGRWISYMCDDKEINAYVITNESIADDGEKNSSVIIYAYCMLENEKAVTYEVNIWLKSEENSVEDYFREDTLREIISISEYK